jgi:AraC family transcriptional regulator
METLAERFDVKSGSKLKFVPCAVTLRDEGLWPGVRIERWEGGAQPVPETILSYHVLSASLDIPSRKEFRWSGHRVQNAMVAPGAITVIPAQLPYSTAGNGNWRGHMVGIAHEFLKSAAHSTTGAPIELVPELGREDLLLRELINSLAADAEARHPNGSTFGEAICAALAAHVLRHCAANPRRPVVEAPFGDDVRRERVRSYLLDQIDRQVTLAELAALIGTDVFSLIRWFKSSFGLPPHQFILRSRIERARALLRTAETSLVEIALQCGFSSQSHFTTAFRRLVGTTPAAYRASLMR